jgi:phospholipase C
VFQQPNGSATLLPNHPPEPLMGYQFIGDLPHSWSDAHAAWNNGNNDGWVAAKGTETMCYVDRTDIPFHYALADAFTICDNYHCSIMSATDPNRYYLFTGWVGQNGLATDTISKPFHATTQGRFDLAVGPSTGNGILPGGPVVNNDEQGYNWLTYPERLEAAGVSWKFYQDVGIGLDPAGAEGFTDNPYIGNFGDNSVLYFFQYQNALPGSALFERARRGTRISPDGTLPDINAARNLFTQLAADVRSNSLPQVSWIAAPEAFSEHPNWPGDFGAWYTSQVLDVLTSNPESWSKTVFLVNWDENGGFFDHLVPPYPPQDRAHGLSTVDTTLEIFPGQKRANGTLKFAPGPYGLGVRVPMLVVSPWSKGGFVCSEVFDHTSTIRFIEKRFGPTEPNITPWRRVVCGDLTSAFDFRRPDAARVALPSTAAFFPPDSLKHSDPNPVPPSPQIVPVQEPGQRPARPLPYELDASARVDTQGHSVTITFTNTGGAGAAFQARSGNPADLPRTYTVEADKSLSDIFALASPFAYDLAVSGPNGFVRRFKGNAVAGAADLEIAVRYDTDDGGDDAGISLTITNRGTSRADVVVTDHYSGRARERQHLAPGHDLRLSFELEESFDWYDFSVTVESDGSFLRRLSGHVETGANSFSDPAIGA